MNQLRSNLVAALTGTAVSQILAGIAQVLIVRTLGAAQYGTYALLYAWLAIVTAIIGAGLDLWLLDYGSRHPNQIRTARRRIILIKICIVSGCGLLVVAGISPPQIAMPLVILGLVAVIKPIPVPHAPAIMLHKSFFTRSSPCWLLPCPSRACAAGRRLLCV